MKSSGERSRSICFLCSRSNAAMQCSCSTQNSMQHYQRQERQDYKQASCRAFEGCAVLKGCVQHMETGALMTNHVTKEDCNSSKLELQHGCRRESC